MLFRSDRKNYRKICYFLGIMLNAKGERFLDEGANFRNYTYAQYGAKILEQPNHFAWQIFDDKVKNRISLGGIYKIGMKPLKVKFKTRLQKTHEKNEDPDEVYRNKLYAHYKLNKKLEPFLSYEVFHPANSNDNSLNEYRLSFGTDFDLPRKRSIKLYYQFKVEDLNKKSPDKAYIMGLTFSLN